MPIEIFNRRLLSGIKDDINSFIKDHNLSRIDYSINIYRDPLSDTWYVGELMYDLPNEEEIKDPYIHKVEIPVSLGFVDMFDIYTKENLNDLKVSDLRRDGLDVKLSFSQKAINTILGLKDMASGSRIYFSDVLKKFGVK